MLMPQIPLKELQNNENNVEDYAPEHPPNAPEYDTTGSVNHEAADVQVVTQAPDSDEAPDDDAAPLLGNKNGR